MYQFNALKESIELHYYHFGNDNIYDIQMGQNAGCRTCGVTRGNHKKYQLLHQGADYVIDDFSGLINSSFIYNNKSEEIDKNRQRIN